MSISYPEAPAEFDVLDIAVRAAVLDVHRMFLPWSEQRKLIFYDDDDCGLKRSSQLLKAQDVEGTFQASQQNLETCKNTPKVKDKVLGHAYYNMGMSHMMRDEYDQALEQFREAAQAGRHRQQGHSRVPDGQGAGPGDATDRPAGGLRDGAEAG